MCPGRPKGARNTPTSAQELLWNLESAPFPGEEGGNENWVFCCFSCKHALGSYPFPLPLPYPLSHKFGSTGFLPNLSATGLAYSSGKFPARAETVSWGMDSKGSIKMKNAKEMPIVTHWSPFLTFFGILCSEAALEVKQLLRKSKKDFEKES